MHEAILYLGGILVGAGIVVSLLITTPTHWPILIFVGLIISFIGAYVKS